MDVFILVCLMKIKIDYALIIIICGSLVKSIEVIDFITVALFGPKKIRILSCSSV